MKFNTKYEVVVSSNEISTHGIIEIDNYLCRQQLPYPLGFRMSKWVDTSGEFRGKLANRLGGYYKKKYDIKLTPGQRTDIGNIARRYVPLQSTYTVDFVDEFDWEDGDFGDTGSCFWGTNALALEVLEDEGAVAIRFYEGKRGYGRAWLYQWDEETFVLFNAYGEETQPAANVLAEYLSQDTGKTWCYRNLDRLTVSGKPQGLIYMNANPQVVFVDGSGPPHEVDLDWPLYIACDDCESWIHEGDAHEVDDEMLCPGCIANLTACWRCEEYLYDDDVYMLEEEPYCLGCYERRQTEIEEELRIERLEMRQDAARIIREAKDLISSLTRDEQLAAGQLELEMEIKEKLREELEHLREQDAAGLL